MMRFAYPLQKSLKGEEKRELERKGPSTVFTREGQARLPSPHLPSCCLEVKIRTSAYFQHRMCNIHVGKGRRSCCALWASEAL